VFVAAPIGALALLLLLVVMAGGQDPQPPARVDRDAPSATARPAATAYPAATARPAQPAPEAPGDASRAPAPAQQAEASAQNDGMRPASPLDAAVGGGGDPTSAEEQERLEALKRMHEAEQAMLEELAKEQAALEEK
jgi:hypothetical protein